MAPSLSASLAKAKDDSVIKIKRMDSQEGHTHWVFAERVTVEVLAEMALETARTTDDRHPIDTDRAEAQTTAVRLE